ncbi:Hypothetical protein HVR_LOCUS1184 [uncultured virus]|nr:Hypothetical protein HVR_LOCUS1184 [uncultured virus]
METSPDIYAQTSQTSIITAVTGTTSDIKTNIDEEYATKPHGGSNYEIGASPYPQQNSSNSKTVWIIVGLAIALIIIFGIVMLVFFLLANKSPMHEITVINNSSQAINILVGTEINNSSSVNLVSTPPIRLTPGQVNHFYATPGAQVTIQGYLDGTIIPKSYPYPFTKLLLFLAGEGYNGKVQITDGNSIIDVPSMINITNQDIYDISLQDGFNLVMSVASTDFNNANPGDQYSCVGPNFGSIPTCPTNLQYPITTGTGQYQACMTPCFATKEQGITGAAFETTADAFCCVPESTCSQTGGCQNSWIDPYTIFYTICQTCMITNCDFPLYHCGSVGGLTQYTVTFRDS